MNYQVSLEESYKNQFNAVGLFHDVFGHPHELNPVLNIFENNIKLVDFRINLIEEEVEEFADEISKNKLIHAIDAICDILYVVNGAYHVFGAKYPMTSNELYTFEFVNSNYYDSIFETYVESLNNSIKYLRDFVEGLKMCATNHDFYGFVQILHLIQNECYNISKILKFNIDLMFNVVQSCNMSKVCETEQLAIDSVEWYKENESRYAEPSYKKSNNGMYWVIYDKATSKTLKSKNWTEPEPLLTQVLYNNSQESVVMK